ncbi:MAG: hypothetical protein ACYSUX_16180 [Planctomycetota bacterium]|jgi:hypothetical protein
MKTIRFRYCVSGLLLFGLLTGGCSVIGGSRPVNVTASDPICNKSVEVHLVGINSSEKDLWQTMSMADYWTPGNQLRKSAREYTYVIQFGRGPCTVTLGKKDPIRRIWKSRKVEYLYVLADLPGVFTDSTGNADARRLQLPATNSKRWGWRDKKIDIRIEESNIVSLTVPKPD